MEISSSSTFSGFSGGRWSVVFLAQPGSPRLLRPSSLPPAQQPSRRAADGRAGFALIMETWKLRREANLAASCSPAESDLWHFGGHGEAKGCARTFPPSFSLCIYKYVWMLLLLASECINIRLALDSSHPKFAWGAWLWSTDILGLPLLSMERSTCRRWSLSQV